MAAGAGTANAGTAYVTIEPDLAALQRKLGAAMSDQRMRQFGKRGGVALAGGLAAGTAILGSRLGDALDTGALTAKLNAQLGGASKTASRRAGAVAGQLYGEAYGGGLEEVNTALRGVMQNVRGMSRASNRELKNVSAGVLDLATAFDQDLGGVTAAVGQMLRTGMARDAEHALDALTIGFQGGVDKAGDLLDTVVEYGTQFRKLGIDGPIAMGLLSQGLRAGARDADVVADAIKEFSIRAVDGSRLTADGFRAIGLNAEDMTAKIAQGGPAARAGLEQTLTALRSVRDPADRAAAAVALFGTQSEDLGAALFNLVPSKATRDLDRVEGATRRMGDALNDNTKVKLEAFRRRVDKAIVGFLGNDVLPVLEKVGGRLQAIFDDRSLDGGEKFRRAFEIISDEVERQLGAAADAAADAGPEIAKRLAGGFIEWWADASPVAKLFATAAIIRTVGGPGAITASGAALGRLLGGGITAGAATAVAGGAAGAGAAGAAAGAAASGGLIATMRTRLLSVAKRAGLVGVGVVLADGVIDEMGRQAALKGDDWFSALRDQAGGGGMFDQLNISRRLPLVGDGFTPGWEKSAKALEPVMSRLLTTRSILSRREIDDIAAKAQQLRLTEGERQQFERILSLLRTGSRLRMGVDLRMDPGKLKQFENGLSFLRSGVGNSLGDILRVSRRNMRLIGETWGHGTAAGRRAAAENMRAAADAIERQMRRSGRVTNAGVQNVVRLLRNADLISPTRKMAEDFGRGWAAGMDSGKEITRRGLDRMLAEARKMPGPMRKVALETWLTQIEQARRGGRITTDEFRDMRSKVIATFPGLRTESRRTSRGISTGFIDMANTSTSAMEVLIGNMNRGLTGFGVRPLAFSFEKAGDEQKRQTGGAIVPGSGSGDTFRTMLPPGSYVLNRNATSAFFQNGGHVPVALEPRERVFFPDDVRRIGLGQLEAMNASVPRFQTGGAVGGLNFALGPYDIPPIRYDSGHAGGNSHVHVTGTTTAWVVALGRKLQQMGFMVGEHPAFGGVDAVHSATGGHYHALAIDINSAADETRAEVASIARLLGGSMSGAIGAAFELARLNLTGDGGPLRSIGQAAIDRFHAAAKRYGESRVPSMEGPEPRFMGGAGGTYDKPRLMQLWQSQGGPASVANLAAAVALAESSGNPGSIGIPTTAGRAHGLWQIMWPLHAPSYPGRDPLNPADNAYMAVRLSNGGTNWQPWEAYTRGMHTKYLQLGGLVQALQGGGSARRGRRNPILSAIDALYELRNGRLDKKALQRDRRQRARILKRSMKAIEGVGLSAAHQRRLVELSGNVDLFDEYAGRAGSESYELLYKGGEPVTDAAGVHLRDAAGNLRYHEAGDPVLDGERRPMTFFARVAGKTEAEWTQARLDALLALRGKLIGGSEIVRAQQLEVARLIERARRRLDEVNELIRRSEQRRAKVRREARALERRIERDEDRLEDYRRRPSRHRDRIAKLRASLPDDRAQLRRLRAEDRALGPVIEDRTIARDGIRRALGDDDSGLLGRRARMNELYPQLLGQGGDSFKGLVTVQGLAPNYDRLTGVPEIGVLGGEIYDAQTALRQLNTRPNPVPAEASERDVATSPDTSATDALRAQIAEDWQRRYVLSQVQYGALDRWLRAVSSTVGGELPPYGGSFSTGGMVPGPRGAPRTIIAHGGERVLSLDQQAGTRSGEVRSIRVEDHRSVVDIDGVEHTVALAGRKTVRAAQRAVPGTGGRR